VTTGRLFLWLVVVMSGVVAGVVGLPAWAVIPTGAVAILWLKGRHRHERLAAKSSGGRRFILTAKSMAVSLVVSAMEAGVSWGLGTGMRWLAMGGQNW